MSLTLTEVKPERGRHASGGFGDIYKGRCFGEEVALKVLRLPLPSGVNGLTSWRSFDGRAQEYLSEVLIWTQLLHPNILPFYGLHFLDTALDTRVCLVCPWMENRNVVEFLDRRNCETDATDCVSLVSKFHQVCCLIEFFCFSRHLILQRVSSISTPNMLSTKT